MPSLKDRLVALLQRDAGLTDREITDRLFDSVTGPQAVNQAARSLNMTGRVVRRARSDGQIGNYLAATGDLPAAPPKPVTATDVPIDMLSEDQVKRYVQAWLEASGWHVSVLWGHDRGIDIHAQNNGRRWIIEAKGCGSLNAMRVNYFLSILGELLQRMDDADAKYSIALPDMKQFRGLWDRLPTLAKRRTRISALFVSTTGEVTEHP
jgi:hypothetical protein